MKALQAKLLKLSQSWNASGEFDGTEFEGRHFIGDNELDEFAAENNLNGDWAEGVAHFDIEKIEAACNCQLIFEYGEANPDRRFGDQEIFFEGVIFLSETPLKKPSELLGV